MSFVLHAFIVTVAINLMSGKGTTPAIYIYLILQYDRPNNMEIVYMHMMYKAYY